MSLLQSERSHFGLARWRRACAPTPCVLMKTSRCRHAKPLAHRDRRLELQSTAVPLREDGVFIIPLTTLRQRARRAESSCIPLDYSRGGSKPGWAGTWLPTYGWPDVYEVSFSAPNASSPQQHDIDPPTWGITSLSDCGLISSMSFPVDFSR